MFRLVEEELAGYGAKDGIIDDQPPWKNKSYILETNNSIWTWHIRFRKGDKSVANIDSLQFCFTGGKPKAPGPAA